MTFGLSNQDEKKKKIHSPYTTSDERVSAAHHPFLRFHMQRLGPLARWKLSHPFPCSSLLGCLSVEVILSLGHFCHLVERALVLGQGKIEGFRQGWICDVVVGLPLRGSTHPNQSINCT